MKKQLLEAATTKMIEKPRTDMYTQRKTSYACSIDEKFDLQPIDGYVKRNSFTPGVIEENDERINKDQVDTKNSENEENEHHQTVIENKEATDIANEVCKLFPLTNCRDHGILVIKIDCYTGDRGDSF